MPYLLTDWIREEARVQVRLPDPRGGWITVWFRLAQLIGEESLPTELQVRTEKGQEAELLRQLLGIA